MKLLLALLITVSAWGMVQCQPARTAERLLDAPFSQLTTTVPNDSIRMCINCQANGSTGTCESGASQMVATKLNGVWKCSNGTSTGGGGGSGVTSFNGRTGVVIPALNDYTFSLIGGVAQNRLIGRGASSGTGVLQEITVGSGLLLTGTTLSATGGGGGTVTGSGTLGKVPKWASTSVLTDSNISDSGSSVSVAVSLIGMSSINVGTTLNWPLGTNLSSATNGRLVFNNLAGTGFSSLYFGGTDIAKPHINISSGTGGDFDFVGGSAGGVVQAEGFQTNPSNGTAITLQSAAGSISQHAALSGVWDFYWPNSIGTSGMFLQTNGVDSGTWAKVNLASTTNVTGVLPVANGGTGLSAITANRLVKGNGTSPTVVTGVSVDSSDNVDVPGSVTIGTGSGVAGNIGISQGTATAVAANTIQIQAPASVTGYNFIPPDAAGNGVLYNSNSSNVVTQTFVNAETVLSTTASVNLNTATPTVIYTCPTGKTCVITRFVFRVASTSLTTVSFSIGWNSAAYDNVIANATRTELTGATIYSVASAKTGSTLGASTETLRLLCNTLQGAPATFTVDAVGFIY